MLSKPKTVPLLYLYLLLSHAVVTPTKTTASSNGPQASKESLQNLRQVAHVTTRTLSKESPENLRQVSNVTVPAPNHDFLEYLQTRLPVVASPPMNVIPKIHTQDSHGIEDRLLDIGEFRDAVNTLAKSLQTDQFRPTGIYKYVPKLFQKPQIISSDDSRLLNSLIREFKSEIRRDVIPFPHNNVRLIKWIKKIKKSFPVRRSAAYSVIAVILSENLGNFKASEVIAGLMQHHSHDFQLIQTALFQHWRNKNMGLKNLLEEEEWTLSEDVIKTLRNPGFSVINNFASILEKEDKQIAFVSFMEKLHDSKLEDKVEEIISLGQRAFPEYVRTPDGYVMFHNDVLAQWIMKLGHEYVRSNI